LKVSWARRGRCLQREGVERAGEGSGRPSFLFFSVLCSLDAPLNSFEPPLTGFPIPFVISRLIHQSLRHPRPLLRRTHSRPPTPRPFISRPPDHQPNLHRPECHPVSPLRLGLEQHEAHVRRLELEVVEWGCRAGGRSDRCRWDRCWRTWVSRSSSSYA
jgi:hypothetical protein